MTWRPSRALPAEAARARSRPCRLPRELRCELMAPAPNSAVRGAPQPLAVRSSATTEDAEDASFAGLQDTYLWVIGVDCGGARAARLLGEPVFGAIDRLSAQAGTAGGGRGDGRGRAAHGGCAHRRRDVHAQPHHRRPFGDRHRGRVGPGLGRGQRRSDAGPLRGRQDHRRDHACATSATSTSGMCRCPAAARTRWKRRRTLRNEPCVSDDELQRAARPGPAHRAPLRPPAGHRVGHRPGRQRCCILQSRPETVWSAQEAAPVAAVAGESAASCHEHIRRADGEPDREGRGRDPASCWRSRASTRWTWRWTACRCSCAAAAWRGRATRSRAVSSPVGCTSRRAGSGRAHGCGDGRASGSAARSQRRSRAAAGHLLSRAQAGRAALRRGGQSVEPGHHHRHHRGDEADEHGARRRCAARSSPSRRATASWSNTARRCSSSARAETVGDPPSADRQPRRDRRCASSAPAGAWDIETVLAVSEADRDCAAGAPAPTAWCASGPGGPPIPT